MKNNLHFAKARIRTGLLRLFPGHKNIAAISVLLLVGSILSWVVYDEYRQTQDVEFRLLDSHARNAGAKIADALDGIGHLLNQVAQARLNSHSVQDKALIAFLVQHRIDIPEIDALLVTDAAGRIRTATDAAIVGLDVSKEPYFAGQLASGQTPALFISRPDKNLHGVTTVTFSFPILDTDNRFIGIAAATIGYKFFPEALRSINPDDSASMSVIFNRDGDLMYRRAEPEKFFGSNIVEVSTVFQAHALAGSQVTRHIGPSAHNGKTRLFLVRDVGNTGLSLILSRQLDEVLARWLRNIVIYSLIFLFTVVAVTSLAIIAARRKQLENARLEILDRSYKIASQVPGLVFQYRLYPDGHSCFPFASDAIHEIFRVTPEDVREDAARIFSLIHPDDHDAVVASIRKSAQDLTPWHQEYRVNFEDGTTHWLHGNALPQQEAEGVVLWHGFVTDISERKQMEADIFESHTRLHEIEQQQMLSRERQRLMQDMHDGLGSSLVSALKVVERGQLDAPDIAQLLQDCINDLKLAIDSMEPVDADLLLLLATLRYRLEPRLKSSHIALRWAVGDVPALHWLAPQSSLHILRILQEAFTNIIKHTHTSEIRLATEIDGDFVVVCIADNGQGFAFEEALKHGGKGISNQLRRAEAIGAEVRWKSNGFGTCFTLRLPIAPTSRKH